jgi:amino acid transporter
MARPHGTGLQRDAVGLMSVLFMSVTNMAPAAAVAFSILFAAPYAGGSTPLAVLLGLAVLMLVAISIGQLAKHLPSAGGLYTYNTQGLGAVTGFLVGWAFIMAEVIVAPGGFLILGTVISGVLHTNLGWPTWTWAPFGAVAAVLTWYLVYRGIRLSTSAGVILGSFELLVFLALAITLIVAAGPHNTLAVFGAHTGNAKGWGSVIPGVLYAVFGIIGFEAAAPLGEEAREPKRTVPRAVVLSCLAIGIFYLICYYAATVYWGPHHMTGFLSFNSDDPWTGLANKVWGLGFIAVVIALVNSGLAGSNASSTATTRVGYAMGRVGLLPRVFTTVNDRYRTPTWAVHVQALFALTYLLVLGFALHGPLNALVLQGTISTILIVAIYILTCVSCIVYYLRAQRRHFNVLLHLVIPLVGALALIPVLLAAFGIDFAHLGITGLTYPASLAPLICLAWMVLGLVLLGYFMIKDRSRIVETRRVFTEQTPAERESV